MAFNIVFLLCLYTQIITTTVTLKTFSEPISPNILDVTSLNRSSFPTNFIFGASNSAYQVFSVYSLSRSFLFSTVKIDIVSNS